MSSRLGRVWFFGVTAGLTQFGRPKGVGIKRWPCTIRVGNGCEVGRCGGNVSIALVLVLAVTLLAVIHVVAYMYSK